jgi:hypothetical protein
MLVPAARVGVDHAVGRGDCATRNVASERMSVILRSESAIRGAGEGTFTWRIPKSSCVLDGPMHGSRVLSPGRTDF